MDAVIMFDSVYWTLLIANVLPLLVGFVTNEVARAGVREALLAFLTGITVWAEETFAAGGSFEVEAFLLKVTALFLVSVGMYFGWQRNTVAPPVQRSGFSLGA